ncbi:unnamed protein product [Blepharisma stoltei]|uniref:non-specific serine/threonine protein kinase n=1 Tax=Blepharisma stoltei TaxID=1481888 RepID=A0AAU9K8W7_9CILI|nr:unnamed protein product [Blepharisma stoltei]
MDKLVIKKQWFITSQSADITSVYEFERELGSGAYGKVFLGREISTNIYRAIKVVQKNRVKDYDTFCNEIDILKHLDHPNIVNIIETYETNRLCYLVMELCQGGELFDRITAHRYLDEVQAAVIMRSLFSAIMYCHDHGVCHRDLKPENCVFVSNEQNSDLKVIDFGLAKVVDEYEVMHSLDGTPYYLAPEVIEGNYSKEVDCWSLGVILYIMLSGVPPFNGRNNEEVLMNVFNGNYSFRPKQFSKVSDMAKDLIARLLVKDPSIRITAKQAFTHPWIQNLASNQSIPLDPYVFNGIQLFSHAQKLKRVTLMLMASKLSEREIEVAKEAFKKIDMSGDGMITLNEMEQGMRSCGIRIDKASISSVFEILDSNQNGKIDYTEFIAACIFNQSFQDSGLLKTAFRYFDIDGSGYITIDELREVLTGGDISITVNPADLASMIREVDKNRDGRIDYMEFIEMMNRKG